MSEPNDKPDTDFAEILAKYARIERIGAGAWPNKKAAVLQALAAAGITHVIVSFDGYGDSGQVESIEAKAGDVEKELPQTQVALRGVDYETESFTTTELVLSEAIEHLVYDCLRQTHCGWENNEGAYGEVTFDVAEGTVTLDYNERYESSEYTQHIL